MQMLHERRQLSARNRAPLVRIWSTRLDLLAHITQRSTGSLVARSLMRDDDDIFVRLFEILVDFGSNFARVVRHIIRHGI